MAPRPRITFGGAAARDLSMALPPQAPTVALGPWLELVDPGTHDAEPALGGVDQELDRHPDAIGQDAVLCDPEHDGHLLQEREMLAPLGIAEARCLEAYHRAGRGPGSLGLTWLPKPGPKPLRHPNHVPALRALPLLHERFNDLRDVAGIDPGNKPIIERPHPRATDDGAIVAHRCRPERLRRALGLAPEPRPPCLTCLAVGPRGRRRGPGHVCRDLDGLPLRG